MPSMLGYAGEMEMGRRMIQVEKHGNQYGWYRCTCPECGCEYVFSYNDIKSKIVYSSYVEKIVHCPECGEETSNWKCGPR